MLISGLTEKYTKTVGITVGDMAKEGLTILYITDFGKEFLKFIEVRK